MESSAAAEEAAQMKAAQFVAKLKKQGLHKQGWVGAFWDEDELPEGQVVLECLREGDGSKTVDEVILQCWEGRNWIKGLYRVYGREKAIKNAADALRLMTQSPARAQTGKKPSRMTGKSRAGLPAPDFANMTDDECLHHLAGKTITFRRGIDGVEESVTIPPLTREEEDAKGKIRVVQNDIRLNRVVNFVSSAGGTVAYRAVNVSNIISIS